MNIKQIREIKKRQLKCPRAKRNGRNEITQTIDQGIGNGKQDKVEHNEKKNKLTMQSGLMRSLESPLLISSIAGALSPIAGRPPSWAWPGPSPFGPAWPSGWGLCLLMMNSSEAFVDAPYAPIPPAPLAPVASWATIRGIRRMLFRIDCPADSTAPRVSGLLKATD